jgi:hypothetical protein
MMVVVLHWSEIDELLRAPMQHFEANVRLSLLPWRQIVVQEVTELDRLLDDGCPNILEYD